MKKREHSYTVTSILTGAAVMENSMEVLKKLKTDLQ